MALPDEAHEPGQNRVAGAQPTNGGIYSVLVTNAYGSALSSNAVITVTQVGACTNVSGAVGQLGRHLGDAKDADADCLVTPCPLCHLNLDLQQPLAERLVGRELDMPVLHLPQLVGLALGLEPKELGLQRHVVKPTSVIDWSTSIVAGV